MTNYLSLLASVNLPKILLIVIVPLGVKYLQECCLTLPEIAGYCGTIISLKSYTCHHLSTSVVRTGTQEYFSIIPITVKPINLSKNLGESFRTKRWCLSIYLLICKLGGKSESLTIFRFKIMPTSPQTAVETIICSYKPSSAFVYLFVG